MDTYLFFLNMFFKMSNAIENSISFSLVTYNVLVIHSSKVKGMRVDVDHWIRIKL